MAVFITLNNPGQLIIPGTVCSGTVTVVNPYRGNIAISASLGGYNITNYNIYHYGGTYAYPISFTIPGLSSNYYGQRVNVYVYESITPYSSASASFTNVYTYYPVSIVSVTPNNDITPSPDNKISLTLSTALPSNMTVTRAVWSDGIQAYADNVPFLDNSRALVKVSRGFTQQTNRNSSVVLYFNNNVIQTTNSGYYYKPPIISSTVGNSTGYFKTANGLIVLYGNNFYGISSANIDGKNVPIYQLNAPNFLTSYNATDSIWLKPDADQVSGKITLVNSAGSATSNLLFYNALQPTITSISKTTGLSGEVVEINGTNFTFSGTNTSVVVRVEFNTANTSWLDVTETKIRAIVPPSAQTGKITVSTSGGVATSTETFTQVYPPSGELEQKSFYKTGDIVAINGGSLDTLQEIKFRFTNATQNGRTGEYSATFSIVDSSKVNVTIPFMDNKDEGGDVFFTLKNAYATNSGSSKVYDLLPDYQNLNYPTISSYSKSETNNTTPTNYQIGANLYFNKDNSWEPAQEIYFAKPTTRKDGLTENSEWTKATSAYFSNNGEWQKFWPSIEAQTKKFYKFEWESSGIPGKVRIIKMIPEYPYVYMLVASEFEAYDSKSYLVKFNFIDGSCKYIAPLGIRGTNTAHFSDFCVTGDALYTIGYDHAYVTNSGGAPYLTEGQGLTKSSYPHARFVTTIGQNVDSLATFVGTGGYFHAPGGTAIPFTLVVKKYSKNLGLLFSRSCDPQGVPTNTWYNNYTQTIISKNDQLAYTPGSYLYEPSTLRPFFFKSLRKILGTSGEYEKIFLENTQYEPKITFFNGAIYMFFPVVDSLVNQYHNLSNMYSSLYYEHKFPNRDRILVKKLRPSNLTEYPNDTYAKTLATLIRLPPVTQSDLGAPQSSQYSFFKPDNKYGFNHYSIIQDAQLNGDNKLIFNTGFYWNSLQINPSIKDAKIARDGNFDYMAFIGDLESPSTDDNENGMIVGICGKNAIFDVQCGNEQQLGKQQSTSLVEYSNINSFLENYSTLPNAYASNTFPLAAYTVTESLQDNGGTGYTSTEICNA